MAINSIEDFVYQFVEDLEFDVLIMWAKILDIREEYPPLEELYPEWIEELKEKVCDGLLSIGETEKKDIISNTIKNLNKMSNDHEKRIKNIETIILNRNLM